MTFYTPWGDSQETTEVLEGVFSVQTASHGGLMFTPEAAKQLLSEAAIKQGMMACGHYCYEEDVCAAVPMQDSAVVLRAVQAVGYFNGWSEERIKTSLIDSLSSYIPNYLIATGVEPNKEIYQTYLWRKEAEQLRKDKHPDFVVAATGEWRTFVDGITEVTTADGKTHFVTIESYQRRYEDERIGYKPMLSDFVVVDPNAVPPVEDRLIPFVKSRLELFKANYDGHQDNAAKSWQRISDGICDDIAKVLTDSVGQAYGEAYNLRKKVAHAGITYSA